MALIPDSLSVRPIDGLAFRGVTDDATTQIGLYVELDGEPVAVDSGCTCTLRYGSATVSPTVSVATAGEVVASITTANLTTLGVTMLGGVVAYFSGTVSSGARQLKYEMPFVIMDRGKHVPVTYAELKRAIPQLNHSAVNPSGQTNLWPQVMDLAQEFWTELDAMNPDLKSYLVTNPGELRRAFKPWIIAGIHRYLAGNDNGQSYLSRTAERHEKRYGAVIADLKLTIKTGTEAYGAAGTREAVPAQVAKFWTGQNLEYGGPL